MTLRRRFHFIIATLTCLSVAPAFAEMTVLTYNARFCPNWAEAHERSLASLNHGRPPYPVKWKGCIVVRRGTCVDVVEQQEQSTEIVIRASIGSQTRCRTSFRAVPARQQAPRDKAAPRNDGTLLDTVSTTRLRSASRYSAPIQTLIDLWH
jgi:hypothetical protein